MSLDPRHHVCNIEQRVGAMLGRTPDHHNGNSQCACGFDLSIGRPATAVLGDDDVNAFLKHQPHVVTFGKRPARKNKPVPGQRRHVRGSVDRANDISMLRCLREGSELQPANGQKHPARRITERANGSLDVVSRNPLIAVPPLPSGPAEYSQRNPRPLAGAPRILRHPDGERMRGIDHGINALRQQKIAETIDPAKPADTKWNGRRRRVFGASRERQYRVDVAVLRETSRQLARLSRASEDKNPHLAAPRGFGP